MSNNITLVDTATTPSQAVSVPNGNKVISPEVANYVDRYKTFLVKTAESILGLAQTLIEAETVLNGVDFAIFLENVGIDRKGPTYAKLKKIGETLTRFQPFVTRLPNTWTTIYKLAKLEPNKFDQVSANLTPFITAKEIDELVGSENHKMNKRSDLTIDLDTLDTQQKAEFYASLQSLKQRFGFSIKEGRSLIDELKAVKTAKAA